ncbi:hypothetical protein FAM22021_002336 [Propionibacterium freudenreichii]|nr:hypothetical protein [Propionibacterium freudenreichii]
MLPIVVGLQKGTKPVKSMLVEVTRDGVLNEPEDRNAYATPSGRARPMRAAIATM